MTLRGAAEECNAHCAALASCCCLLVADEVPHSRCCVGWCCQVEDVAITKHGSLEALEAEKQRRMQGKLEQRIQKRQAAEQEEELQRRHEERLQATLAKYTRTDGDLPEVGGGFGRNASEEHGEFPAASQAAGHLARLVMFQSLQ